MAALRWTRRASDPRSRTTRAATQVVAMVGIMSGIGAVSVFVSTVRGRTWMLNGPDPVISLADLPQVPWTGGDVDALATAVDLPAVTRVLVGLPALIDGLLLALGALFVVGIVREIARGRSFSVVARLGLGRLSLTLIIGGVISVAADIAALVSLDRAVRVLRAAWLDRGVGYDVYVSVSGMPSIPVLVIVLGVIAAAVLFALTDGARLEKDVEGVI